MIRIFIKFSLCISLLIQWMPTYCMLTALRTRSWSVARPSNPNRLPQKRYQWQPSQLKGTSTIIIPTNYPNKNFIASGAAVADSHWLKNIMSYNVWAHKVDTSDSLMKLSNELFQLSANGQISIIMDKNKISYLLTPEFFGVLRGAQEKGLLEDASVVKKLVTLGKAEYSKLTTENGDFPEEQVKDFIAVMNDAHKKDASMAQSLQDAYLFLRTSPNNNHDLIHYLLGFNLYGGIFSEQRLAEFKKILASGKSSAQESISEYNVSDYEKFKDSLLKKKMPSDQIKYAQDNFPLAISAILQEKRNKALYSPRVIMSEGSYLNQSKFSACAESAFRDLLNNLFFDETTQVFDPVTFFPTLKINNDVIQFFNQYKTIDTINDSEKDIQQSFIKLVSNVPGVTYVKNNYEISSVDNEQNLLALCNHFFSIRATNLDELGKLLSSDNKTIVFELIQGRDNNKKIAITINDKKTEKKKYMYLCFVPGHSWFEVGQENSDKVFLDPKALLEGYNNPQGRSLLYAHPQPVIDLMFFRKAQKNTSLSNLFDSSIFYAFPVRDDYEKSRLIRAILLYSKDRKAIDYAYFLFDSLSDYNKALLKDVAIQSDIFMKKLGQFNFLFNEKRIPKE